LSEKTEEN
jgi:hypothetical protein